MSDKTIAFLHWLFETIILAAVMLGIAQILLSYVIANEQIIGPSMEPTFTQNDRVIALRNKELTRGEVIILKAPDEADTFYIKRIIGLPGDTVESKNDKLYINGKLYKEPYLNEFKKEKHAEHQLLTKDFSLMSTQRVNKVPKGEYFVMGDHRDVSKDSRIIGFIDKSAVQGVVVMRYWPFTKINFF